MESQLHPQDNATYSQAQIPIKPLDGKKERVVEVNYRDPAMTSRNEVLSCKSTSEKKFERLQKKSHEAASAVYAS